MTIDGGGVVQELLRALDLSGVAANAMLGGAVARAERLDPVGFVVLAIMSGLGGGMIRDTLLQHGPPVALTDYAYLVTALAAAAVAILIRFEGVLWERMFPYIDGLALGCWAAVGAQKSLLVGLGWLPAILLGTVTAVGGGMIRDITMRRIPEIFGGNTLYATCAVVASAVMVVMDRAGHSTVGLVAATTIGAALCLLARRRGWALPPAHVSDDSWREHRPHRDASRRRRLWRKRAP